MNRLKQLAIFYLKGIDASIRYLGAYIIMCFFFMVIYGISYGISHLPFLSISPNHLAFIISLLLFPPIMRISVLGAGLSIPPIFSSKKDKQANPT